MPLRDELPILESFIASVPDPLGILDRKFRYTCFNKAHADAMKASHGVRIRIGRSLVDCLRGEKVRTQVRSDLERALRGKRIVRRGDQFRLTFRPLRNRQKGVAGIALSITGTTNEGTAPPRQDVTSRPDIGRRGRTDMTPGEPNGARRQSPGSTSDLLREREELFHSIVEASHAGIFVLDDQFHLMYVNEELCRMAGYEREELVGKDFRSFMPKDVREKAADRYRRRQQGENIPARYELNLHRKDGGIRHAEMTVSVVPDPSGRRRSVGQFHDITERKKTQKALQMFQYTIDQAFDAVFWITRDARFSYVNNQACRSLGYTREELMRLSLWDIDPVYPKERWDANWEQYQTNRQGGAEQVETLHRRKDGTTFPVEVWSQHLWLEDQELHVAVVRDSSERKRAEEALKEKSEELDRYFTRSLDLLCIADTDGYFRRLNPEWERTLGYTVPELEGKNFLDLIHPDDLQSTAETISKLKGQEEVLNFENRYRCKDGSYRWIEWRSYPSGRSIYAVARDITERKKAEDALRSSLREKEVLLKEIHHRVKNNLQIIASMLHLQAEHAADDRILTQFREAQNRVLSIALVHQKLYSTTNLAEVDFSEYLHDFLRGLLRAYGDVNANLHLDLGDIRLPIDAAIPCGLIINELVSDSLKYAFPGRREGRITLRMRPEGPDDLVLTVHDDGAGIPEQIDPFNGETLGMTLVSILVQQLGGSITLERSKGTLFTITFKCGQA